MRYLKDQELIQYVERELLPGLAEDCITEFYERFGVSLDVSPRSLGAIDCLITSSAAALEPEAMTGLVGAYLAAVFCSSDGARWMAAFDRRGSIDGYTDSRLRLYNDEIDVFGLARKALAGDCSLSESFRLFHRPRTSVARRG